jgi:integrase
MMDTSTQVWSSTEGEMTSDHPNQAMIPAGSARAVTVPVTDPVETAVTLWAEASTRPETRGRDERLRDKREIIRAFLHFTGKHPGEVGPADVREWRRHLEEEGRAENTIYSYISRVSSFYEWLRKHPDLREQIRANPADIVRPKAPRPYQTEKTKAWTDGQMNAILSAIAEEAARGSIHALRDYAVTLFYLFSGLRRNELFGLRGNDLELEEEGLIVRYRRKGGKYQRREVSHPDVREALLAYLKAAKRLSVLQTGEPLWTRHDRASEPGPPLTSRAFANNLKKYAARVGIGQVNIHQTRHTYARIIFEDTGDLLTTQSALDHESQATTRVYVGTIAVKRDQHSARIARRLRKQGVE